MDHNTLLVADGILIYTPPETTTIIDSGFKVTINFPTLQSPVVNTDVDKVPFRSFRLSDSEARCRERSEGAQRYAPRRATQSAQMFGPGSDIAFADDRLLIRIIRDTHLLVFNKFPVFHPQVLLLTADSYRRQQEPLDSNDLSATFGRLEPRTMRFSTAGEYQAQVGSTNTYKFVQSFQTSSRTLKSTIQR